jgi:hypothetical protein
VGKRQLVLVRFGTKADGTRDPGAMLPLGSARAVKDGLAQFNTSGDGAPAGSMGTEMLHGPGMVVELPAAPGGPGGGGGRGSSAPEINQALVNVTDEDIAWPVLSRACRTLGWAMMDVESGRVFG